MNRAYIALGSNLGNPEANIREALRLMNQNSSIDIEKTGSLYLTEPVGYEEQEWFHNTVAQITTNLEPKQLLMELQAIEDKMGRVRTIRWGPRTIDLDIIIYGEQPVKEPDLEIPHPRMEERAFVLAPLSDLVPDLRLPSGKNVQQALNYLSEKKIICIKKKIW